MKNSILPILLVFAIQSITAQDITKVEIDITAPNSKQSWVFAPSKTKMLWIAQNTSETLSLQELDTNFRVMHSKIMKVEENSSSMNSLLNILAKEFHEFKDGVYANGKYHLLFASGRRKKAFQLLTYTPELNKVSVTNILDFDKRERFVTTTTYQNKIYLITILKNSSELIVRSVGDNLKIEKVKFTLNELNRRYKMVGQEATLMQSTLFDELIIEYGATITSSPLLNLTVVDSSGYSHLKMRNEKVKMYFLDGKIYLTVDVPFYKMGTNVFELDLKTGKYNS
ncbi:MAG: hypothetical protein ACI85I_001019 [Arenicella sp.]|jgi:hypothetical protein